MSISWHCLRLSAQHKRTVAFHELVVLSNMNLTAWVTESEEPARKDGHYVLLVCHTRNLRDVRVNPVCELLVANLHSEITGQPSFTSYQSSY